MGWILDSSDSLNCVQKANLISLITIGMEFDESCCIVGGVCPKIGIEKLHIREKTVLGMTMVQIHYASVVL